MWQKELSHFYLSIWENHVQNKKVDLDLSSTVVLQNHLEFFSSSYGYI